MFDIMTSEVIKMNEMTDDTVDFVGDLCQLIDDKWVVSKEFNERLSIAGDLIKNTTRGSGLKVTTHLNKPFKFMGYISVCGKSIEFAPNVFATIASIADNVEMYPRTDNKIQINFTFSDLSRG